MARWSRCALRAAPSCTAQHLEKVGDLKEAREHYVKSGCAIVEVPRMLYSAGLYDDLEAYVNSQVRCARCMWW